ncbi:uncharacterized protein N7483_007713 [Penicillium malachiteum]|uniref:uncharacterized protein n=1 Tax=Penicillium malachiteum TaxID=1324776 RepID=UPI0025487670|nr:uncharacterized protein N7483_007713 [Penicillium malachiteum]KAJ5726356.1 hypothetical protein N7483_007713 [Penicillium malachiteum]
MAGKGGCLAWSIKKKVLIFGSISVLILALGLGLGIGLGLGLKHNDTDDGSGGSDSDTNGNGTSGGNTTVKWQPSVGVKWQIELLYALNDTSADAQIYDIDLFDNPNSTISTLQTMGRKVICYFSAGTYENWRSDADEFKSSDLGDNLSDWPGEKWLDTNSQNVRKIMQQRLDLAVSKGCDGVDPDNIDAYDNKNGLDLTEDDAIDYVNWLASEAHGRNLSLGLKNGGDIIDSVIDNMQWSVNEQCAQYDECDTYSAFIDADKPVFHIEYPKGDDTDNDNNVTSKQKNTACNAANVGNFSTVIKNMDLDNWVEYC